MREIHSSDIILAADLSSIILLLYHARLLPCLASPSFSLLFDTPAVSGVLSFPMWAFCSEGRLGSFLSRLYPRDELYKLNVKLEFLVSSLGWVWVSDGGNLVLSSNLINSSSFPPLIVLSDRHNSSSFVESQNPGDFWRTSLHSH